MKRKYTTTHRAQPGKERMSENTFDLYQIDSTKPGRRMMFTDSSYHASVGAEITASNYKQVYTAPLRDTDTLEGIYQRFNIDRPADFTGHSLSVSDMIVLHKDGETLPYFVDTFGFKLVPDFLNSLEKVEELL